MLEAHHQAAPAAPFAAAATFDAGATQVAGFEPGSGHQRLFAELGVPLPQATPLDPGCVVDLGDGQPAVQIWRDPKRWRQERQRQFPGSERFWQLCERLHRSNWAFAAGQPVLPPRNLWDLQQLVGALKPATLASGIFGLASVADLLRLSGCSGPQHQRLRRFLDLQLKLYSQEPAERTAALYGVTVLSMVQEPLGLWHLRLDAGPEPQPGNRPGAERRRAAPAPPGGAAQRQPRWLARAGTAPRAALSTEARRWCAPPQALPKLLGPQMPSGLSSAAAPG